MKPKEKSPICDKEKIDLIKFAIPCIKDESSKNCDATKLFCGVYKKLKKLDIN